MLDFPAADLRAKSVESSVSSVGGSVTRWTMVRPMDDVGSCSGGFRVSTPTLAAVSVRSPSSVSCHAKASKSPKRATHCIAGCLHFLESRVHARTTAAEQAVAALFCYVCQ